LRGIGPEIYHIYMSHLTEHDLERYTPGMVTDPQELAALEEHYLGCPVCAELAQRTEEYVIALRRALIVGNFDLE
jgi:hypothetical protein